MYVLNVSIWASEWFHYDKNLKMRFLYGSGVGVSADIHLEHRSNDDAVKDDAREDG